MPGLGQLQLAHLDAHLGRDRAQRLPAAQPPRLRLPASTCATCGATPGPALVPALRLPLDRLGDLHPHGDGVPLLRASAAGRSGTRALLAPRFLASAFVTGPAFIIVSLQHRAALHALHGPRRRRSAGCSRHPPRHRPREPLHARLRALHASFYTGGAPRRLGALPLLRAARPPRARAVDLDLHHPQRRRRGPCCSRPRCGERRVVLNTALVRRLRRRLDREGHGAHRPGLRAEHAARDRGVRAVASRSGR